MCFDGRFSRSAKPAPAKARMALRKSARGPLWGSVRAARLLAANFAPRRARTDPLRAPRVYNIGSCTRLLEPLFARFV